jgi:hypothetical protein
MSRLGGFPDRFVANLTGGASFLGSLTELNSTTGALVRVISGSVYKFDLTADMPGSMTVAGGDVLVANASDRSVTEVNASTGALVRLFAHPLYSLDFPSALVVVGHDLYVANEDGTTVTELSI